MGCPAKSFCGPCARRGSRRACEGSREALGRDAAEEANRMRGMADDSGFGAPAVQGGSGRWTPAPRRLHAIPQGAHVGSRGREHRRRAGFQSRLPCRFRWRALAHGAAAQVLRSRGLLIGGHLTNAGVRLFSEHPGSSCPGPGSASCAWTARASRLASA